MQSDQVKKKVSSKNGCTGRKFDKHVIYYIVAKRLSNVSSILYFSFYVLIKQLQHRIERYQGEHGSA